MVKNLISGLILAHLAHISPPPQWCIQGLSDAGIPVWVPKLGAQIKEELMQRNIINLIISSTQMRLHVLRHLNQVCNSSLFKYITMYRLYK